MAINIEIDETEFLSRSAGEQNLMLYRVMSAFVSTCDKKHNSLDERCEECEKRLGVLETEKTIAAKTGGVAGLASGGVIQIVLETIKAVWK